MTLPGPQDPTPDSAMDTGSDEGTPGTHLGPGDLSPSEERLLAALERDVGRPETYVAEVRAAEAVVPPPPAGGAPDDGLLPRFEAPGES
jgi:hypothetical protein